jgi:hypothetical protein
VVYFPIKKLVAFIILILLFGIFEAYAQNDSFHYKIKDLKNDWKVYSAKENALVPYIETINSRSNNIYIAISPDDYRENGILLKFKRKSALFINNKLIYNTAEPASIVLSIDSLAGIYGQQRLLLSLYSQEDIHDTESSIISYSSKNPSLFSKMDHLSILPIDRGPIWDFMKIGMIIILILYVILVNIGSRVFNDYYNIINSFIRASTDEYLNRSKKITRIDLIFIIVLAFVISFFIVIAIYQSGFDDNKNTLLTVGSLFAKWFWVLLFLLGWFVLRFVLISLSSDLFKMREIGTIHTFEYLRITNFYSLLFFLFLVLALFVIRVNLDLFVYILIYSIIIISILRALILYFKFLNSSNYTKLYLFAYLCSAELLPVIVGLKFLLKSNLIHLVV